MTSNVVQWGAHSTIGQDLSRVFEYHHTIAEQVPALLRVGCNNSGRIVISCASLRTGGGVRALVTGAGFHQTSLRGEARHCAKLGQFPYRQHHAGIESSLHNERGGLWTRRIG